MTGAPLLRLKNKAFTDPFDARPYHDPIHAINQSHPKEDA